MVKCASKGDLESWRDKVNSGQNTVYVSFLGNYKTAKTIDCSWKDDG